VGVGLLEGDGPAELVGSGRGDVEHRRAEVDAGQRHGVGVVAEVETCADGHFEDLAGGLEQTSLGVAERVAVPERHLLS